MIYMKLYPKHTICTGQCITILMSPYNHYSLCAFTALTTLHLYSNVIDTINMFSKQQYNLFMSLKNHYQKEYV